MISARQTPHHPPSIFFSYSPFNPLASPGHTALDSPYAPEPQRKLHLFKSQINLTEFAAAQGYILDREHSSRNSVAMRGPHEDKIIIARNAASGDWIYFSVTDDQDNGRKAKKSKPACI